MTAIQNIKTFSDLEKESLKENKPIICLLESGSHLSLMEEVIESYLLQNPDSFQSLKIEGGTALDIQFELSILKLPIIIVLFEGNIKAFFQGTLAKHELIEILNQINS